jgi:tetratricopeptide (TPR) repeat protein
MNKNDIQSISNLIHDLDQKAAKAVADRDYDEALTIYQEILSAYETLRREKSCGRTLLNMANVMLLKGDTDKAKEYIDIASDINDLQNDYMDCVNIQILRSNMYLPSAYRCIEV